MQRMLISLLFLSTLLLWQPKKQLFAQFEGYVDIALLGVADENSTENGALFKGKLGWGVGADVLYGKGQLSPLLGLHLQQFNYESNLVDYQDLKLWQLMVPIGGAYHFFPRTASFNLMATAAFAPYFGLDDPPDTNSIFPERNLAISARLGLTFTLDYLYLGTKLHSLPQGRIGSAEKWSWIGSFLVGVRF